MASNPSVKRTQRRRTLKFLAMAGVAQVVPPLVIQARGEQAIKIGFDNPLTGVYANNGKNELAGVTLAVEQINAKGGILGRPVQLIVEDSTSGDVGVALQKARKLVDHDHVDFLVGNANSGMSIAIAEFTHQRGMLQVVPGSHADEITGKSCHWNVFRACDTTDMLVGAIAKSLIESYGKRTYFITADYAFGHSLQKSYDAALKRAGGVDIGASLSPLGTTEYSAYLIKAQAAKPDVIVFNLAGDDLTNALKQAAQFGLQKKFHFACPNLELEVLEALPPEFRIGSAALEWYWKQPNLPHNDEFVDAIKKKTGRPPTARTWLSFTSGWTCALAANMTKSLDAVKMAKALQGFELPPEIGLMPNRPFYRAGQNQLIGSLYVGEAQAGGSEPDDLFKVTHVVDGKSVVGTLEETECKMTWPS